MGKLKEHFHDIIVAQLEDEDKEILDSMYDAILKAMYEYYENYDDFINDEEIIDIKKVG